MLAHFRARLRLALRVLTGRTPTADRQALRSVAGRLDRLAADLDDAANTHGRHPAAIADDLRRTAEDIRDEVDE